MKSSSTANISSCPDCGWSNAEVVDQCPNCKTAARVSAEAEHVLLSAARGSFSLSSLLLVITLLCVGLGLIMFQPVIGVLFILLAVPAVFRVSRVIEKRFPANRPANALDHLEFYIRSFGILFLAGLAGLLLWMAACWTGYEIGSANPHPPGTRGPSNEVWLMMVWGVLSAPIAMWLSVWLILMTWPNRK
jgi:hypothetical protein